MPEGHTIHRLARAIEAYFIGKQWTVDSPQGPFTEGAHVLNARIPQSAQARGKHLFVHCGAYVWHVHLGLYGSFRFRGDQAMSQVPTGFDRSPGIRVTRPQYDDAGWIIPDPPVGAVRARVRNGHVYGDLRGPVKCQVLTTVEYEHILRRLGPDPLTQLEGEISEDLLESFTSNLSRRRIPIATALMDQAVISGVGNVYRAESLYMLRIDPFTSAQQLSAETVRALWGLLSEQLHDGLREGQIHTLRPGEPLVGARGADQATKAQRRHWVYRQYQLPCLRCGEVIARRELQGRRLYWCPGCQSESS